MSDDQYEKAVPRSCFTCPEDLEFAVEFRISKTTGPKSKLFFNNNGSELTRLRKKPTYEANEKKIQ